MGQHPAVMLTPAHSFPSGNPLGIHRDEPAPASSCLPQPSRHPAVVADLLDGTVAAKVY